MAEEIEELANHIAEDIISPALNDSFVAQDSLNYSINTIINHTVIPTITSLLFPLLDDDDDSSSSSLSWIAISLAFFLTLIVITTILGNLLVLIVFLRGGRELRSPSHFLIANLALADFLVSTLCLPFTATQQVNQGV
jgi:hypothetical protein